MDSVSWTIEGVQELFENLDIYNRKQNDAMNGALREGGELMKAKYRSVTPVQPGTPGRAKNDVHTTNVTTDSASGYKSIKVGYGFTYYYMWFLDQGTYSKGNPKGIAPREHITGNYQAWFGEAQKVMAKAMQVSLG